MPGPGSGNCVDEPVPVAASSSAPCLGSGPRAGRGGRRRRRRSGAPRGGGAPPALPFASIAPPSCGALPRLPVRGLWRPQPGQRPVRAPVVVPAVPEQLLLHQQLLDDDEAEAVRELAHHSRAVQRQVRPVPTLPTRVLRAEGAGGEVGRRAWAGGGTGWSPLQSPGVGGPRRPQVRSAGPAARVRHWGAVLGGRDPGSGDTRAPTRRQGAREAL